MNRPRNLIVVSVLLAATAWAAGCGDDTTEPVQPPEPPRPAAITVTPPMAELEALGATVQLSAEVRDQNGQVMAGATVTWASGNSTIATVNTGGLVTAADNGTTTISATAGSVSAGAAITVAQVANGMVVSPPLGTVSAGDTLRLLAEATDANGHAVADIAIAWSSSDTLAATVDASGLVSGIAQGTASITATSASVQAAAQVTVAHRDWAPLVAFYEATNGPEWIANDGWMSNEAIGRWHGVTTGPDGHVTGLDLSASDLAGPIPPQLARLSHLETLDLERNQLAGPIPSELGGLHNLRSLNLGVNDLAGEIPVELGNLTNLEDLRLRRNDLTGPIPVQLGNLRNLERLGLDRNFLTGTIPLSFLRLDRLQLFHFADNTTLCVAGTPEFAAWIVQLDVAVGPGCNSGDREALERLHEATGGKNWTRSDGWLGRGALSQWYGVSTDSLGWVTKLDLSDNGLAGSVPESLGELASLISLQIDGNENLTGSLPLSLSALSLQKLHYANTDLCTPSSASFGEWLAALPSHEGNGAQCPPLSDREILALLYHATGGADWADDGNWLSDQPLGEWNGVETDDEGRVVTLRLPRNNLKGRIPPQLGNLGQLRNLDLSRNSLSGPMPLQLANLSNLSRLDLSINELTGLIPPQVGNLSSLSVLRLHWNGLTGPVPNQLGDLDSLTHLLLSWNNLSGPIPSELADLTGLVQLSLSGNGLTGPIPGQLGNLSNLSSLYLDRNALTGPIPSELSNLSGLSNLVLSGNRLTGSIPARFENLTSVAFLGLAENELTGPIPAGLSTLPRLSRLDLSGNGLSGTIPAELGALTGLGQLDLAANRLAGTLAPELASLTSLSSLYLDGNELTGSIPAEFGGLSRLRVLSIKGNRLSGALPSELGDIAGLQHLYLTDNVEMSGALPSSLTAIDSLEALVLAGTGLCASPDDANLQDWLSNVEVARVRACGVGAASSAYLTQAVQSLDFPVPLVADRSALLRVFITASRPNTEGIPKVRVTFYVEGVETHAVDILGSGTPIPTTVADSESSLEASANVTIPGSVIQPGLEMVIEVDPEETLDPALGVTGRIPETGRAPVHVESLPTLDLTLVPFQWATDPDSSVVDIAMAMAADPNGHGMLADTRIMLPVAEVDANAHEAVLTSTTNVSALIRETYLIRWLESGEGYYMGIMPEPVVGGQSGVAYLGFPVGFSVADPFVIAHELGHNMSLSHAPCGGAGGPDHAFPQSDGSIGGWGYDARAGGTVVSPQVRDMMSYCGPPRWVSDYSFTKALKYRLASESGPGASGQTSARAPTRSLILWGGADDQGNPFLESAFVAEAPPSAPRPTGDYQLVGRDKSGDELFSLRFDMAEVVDADTESHFVVALPAKTEWAGALKSITLYGPGGSTTTDEMADRPLAILRDPDSGQVRGILRGEDATDVVGVAADAVGSAGPSLQVVFSRGIPDPAAWRR